MTAHDKAIRSLAEQHVKALLAADGMTLRSIDETGIVIGADAGVADIAISNMLHALASWWGYRHGEACIEIAADDGAGFFEPSKIGKLVL